MNKQHELEQKFNQISNTFYLVEGQQQFDETQLSNSYSTSSLAKNSTTDFHNYTNPVNKSSINSHILIENRQQNQSINNNNISSSISLLQNLNNNSNINVPTCSSVASSSSSGSLNNSTNNMINNLASKDFDFLSECANSINLDKNVISLNMLDFQTNNNNNNLIYRIEHSLIKDNETHNHNVLIDDKNNLVITENNRNSATNNEDFWYKNFSIHQSNSDTQKNFIAENQFSNSQHHNNKMNNLNYNDSSYQSHQANFLPESHINLNDFNQITQQKQIVILMPPTPTFQIVQSTVESSNELSTSSMPSLTSTNAFLPLSNTSLISLNQKTNKSEILAEENQTKEEKTAKNDKKKSTNNKIASNFSFDHNNQQKTPFSFSDSATGSTNTIANLISMPNQSNNENSSASTNSDNIKNKNKTSVIQTSMPIDPNAPKPPLTGYQYYFKQRQSELRSQDSTLKFGDIVKIVGNEWSKNLDKETKNKFIARGLQEKEQYKKNLKTYKESNNNSFLSKSSDIYLSIKQENFANTSKESIKNPSLATKTIHNDVNMIIEKNNNLAEFKQMFPCNDQNNMIINCSENTKAKNIGNASTEEWNNNGLIKDCCIFFHRDYFNIESYHLKIIERSLKSSLELKQFKLKQSQFKLDNKKLNQMIKSLKCEFDQKKMQFDDMSNKNDVIKSKIRLFKRLVYHNWINNNISNNISQNSTYRVNNAFPSQSNNISLIDNNDKKFNTSNDMQINTTNSIIVSNNIYNHHIQQQSPLNHNSEHYSFINQNSF